MTRASRVVGALNWKYALGELTLIILGVLIALTASAWWEGREHTRRARVYLGELRRDLDATIVQIDTAIAADSFSVDNANRMLRFLRSDQAEHPPLDSIRSWNSARYARFESTNGTVDRLLQTGDLNFIRSDALRSQIAAYASMIRNTQQQLNIQEQIFHEQSNLARERLELHSQWRGNWRDDLPRGARQFAMDAMRRDHVLRGAYGNAVLMQRTHMGRLRQVRGIAVALRDSVQRHQQSR